MMRGAHLLVDSGIFERTELVHQIGLPLETIEMLCNLPPGYLSVQPDAADNVVPLKPKRDPARSGRARRADVLPFPQ
ncbi:hypothetical protein ACU6TU_01750 [Halomonas sp. LS-001]